MPEPTMQTRGRVEDAGRDQVQAERAVFVDHRVSGIVAALEADHHVGVLGEVVDDASLSLISPLCTDDGGYGHASPPNGPARCGQYTMANEAAANYANQGEFRYMVLIP